MLENSAITLSKQFKVKMLLNDIQSILIRLYNANGVDIPNVLEYLQREEHITPDQYQ